ncbi:MAG: GTPase subunit of restriction endonuclease [Segetibacter sp.]|nr:GTPase subunit of restriction endonuclease [Segetibacter sp.]
MSQRIINLYAHLIQNRKHLLIGWYEQYKNFCKDIYIIRGNLGTTQLKAKETYIGTSFADEANPFDAFIYRLLYEQSNGISSRGQSVLSGENLNKFKQAQGFEDIIKNIIVNHDLTSYDELKKWWQSQQVGNNPVLINRAIAACTTTLSSTVDEGKFNQIFYWLQQEALIPVYSQTDPQDWYSKNTFANEHLTKALAGVPEIDEYWISICLWEMYVNISNPFSLKKQVVKYGSPGTGKTYTAKQNTQLLFEIWKDEFAHNEDFDFNNYIETVQFHPSYTYEDFMEGLRPKLDDKNQAQLVLQNGIFKEFCKKAGKWECDIAQLTKEGLKGFKDLTIEDAAAIKQDLNGEHWKYIFDIEDKSKKIADAVPPYFFIIDEINRAELSRVFGELMYCLEYRGIKGAIKTQYANLNNNETGMIKIGIDYQFFIPQNVFLIGTMNTIDRSVESFDFALRRRFRWEEVMPDTTLLYYHLMKHNPKWKKLAENLKDLNSEIQKEPLLGRDFQIGHAYLWDLHYSKELTIAEARNAVWEDSIAPLLQEYLRGTGREDLVTKFAAKFGIN